MININITKNIQDIFSDVLATMFCLYYIALYMFCLWKCNLPKISISLPPPFFPLNIFSLYFPVFLIQPSSSPPPISLNLIHYNKSCLESFIYWTFQWIGYKPWFISASTQIKDAQLVFFCLNTWHPWIFNLL